MYPWHCLLGMVPAGQVGLYSVCVPLISISTVAV